MSTFLLQFICLVYLLLYAVRGHREFEIYWDGLFDYIVNVIVPGAAAGWIFVELVKN